MKRSLTPQRAGWWGEGSESSERREKPTEAFICRAGMLPASGVDHGRRYASPFPGIATGSGSQRVGCCASWRPSLSGEAAISVMARSGRTSLASSDQPLACISATHEHRQRRQRPQAPAARSDYSVSANCGGACDLEPAADLLVGGRGAQPSAGGAAIPFLGVEGGWWGTAPRGNRPIEIHGGRPGCRSRAPLVLLAFRPSGPGRGPRPLARDWTTPPGNWAHMGEKKPG